MLLTVDVGNTHIRFGLYGRGDGTVEGHTVDGHTTGGHTADGHTAGAGDDGPRATYSVRTSPAVTADELALTIRGLLGDDATRLTGIAGLSVVPSVTGELRAAARRYWPRARSVVVAPGVRTGVPLLVDNPRDVGADRVVNALAAHTRVGGACVVVDVDTATTVDVVSAAGELLGGAIAPGVDISVDALAERAAALRKIELVRPRSALGRSTVAALQSGIVIGFAGQVDTLVERLRAEVDGLAGAPVVLTGARAALVAEESGTVTDVAPDLTLDGLRLVWERNR